LGAKDQEDRRRRAKLPAAHSQLGLKAAPCSRGFQTFRGPATGPLAGPDFTFPKDRINASHLSGSYE
jgi:hypothetical protein